MAAYVTGADTELLIQYMQTVEDWLYSGDENVYIKSILEDKASALNELGSKIYKRYHDWERLKESMFILGRSLNELVQKSNDANQSINLTQGEKEEVLKLLADTTSYFNHSENQINTLQKFLDAPQNTKMLTKRRLNLIMYLHNY